MTSHSFAMDYFAPQNQCQN